MNMLRFAPALRCTVLRVRRVRRVFVIAVVGALAGACDDSTSARLDQRGAFSVRLSGAQLGLYVADGTRPVPAPRAAATFASAIVSPNVANVYMISGFRANSEGRQDVLNLFPLAVTGTGEYPAAGDLVLGMAAETGLPEDRYRIVAGTVRITALSRRRIAGEFSGVAVGGPFPDTSFPGFANDTVHLSAGTFDVPIIRP